MPNQQVLLRVNLNGLEQGEYVFNVDHDGLSIPAATAKALHVLDPDAKPLRLLPEGPIAYRRDVADSSLALSVPAKLMELQRFAPDAPVNVHLSPETWGAYVNYDANLRHTFGSGLGSSGPVAFGGVGDLRLLGPDLLGSFGWAYDSNQGQRAGLIRLDSTLTWRPADEHLSVSAGDLLSPADTLAATRQYRFLGIQAGTDFSGSPGWSSAPIASVYGSAQAQSVLELVIDGQRAYSASTPGGPFAMSMPSGIPGGGAALLITDVTGRSVLLPVDVPRVDAQLLRQGLFLWSAGAGVPRFGYATPQSSYSPDPYVYASARYGAFDRMTLRAHTEVGPRLAELEIGADVVALPTLALRGTLAASRSDRGVGGQGRFAMSAVGPWNLAFDADVSRTVGAFDDVVSASGRRFASQYGLSSWLTIPAISELSARLSWQASRTLGVSASYQMSRFAGSGAVGIASLNANYTLAGLPVFANVLHDLGGQRSTTVLAGLSFQIGGAQGSASAGMATGSGADHLGDGPSGTLNIGQPLGEQIGSTGWNVVASRSPGSLFADATVGHSTGYGVAGAQVQTSGASTTAYATLRGSAGLIGWHPFVSDPAHGGVVLVDAGQSGVPVELNGADRGRTSFDGKLVLSGAVAGVPQHVSIDAMDLPIDAVPSVTEGDVAVRDGAATLLPFRVQSNAGAASFSVLFHKAPPPVGSTVFATASSAPIGKDGRAYLPSISAGEVLRVEMPDGLVCLAKTHFDGKGGVGRRLGTLNCDEVTG